MFCFNFAFLCSYLPKRKEERQEGANIKKECKRRKQQQQKVVAFDHQQILRRFK